MKISTLLIGLCLISFTAFAEGKPPDLLREEADRLWTKRDEKSILQECIEKYTKELEHSPKDEGLLTRLAIGYYWKGNHLKGKAYKSERMDAYQAGKSYAAVLCELDPRSVPGNFWHATNNSSFCREKGFFKSTMNISDIRKRIDLVLEEDKFYYDGGPQRLLARIIHHTPKLGRSITGSLKDAEEYLKQAISRYPDFTLTHLFLADLYWKMKKKDRCRAELITVLKIPESSPYEPENRRDKKDAKARLLEYFKETM